MLIGSVGENLLPQSEWHIPKAHASSTLQNLCTSEPSVGRKCTHQESFASAGLAGKEKNTAEPSLRLLQRGPE